MNQIPCCDWLPKRARWSYLTHLGLSAMFHNKNKIPGKPYNNDLLTKLMLMVMANDGPNSFLGSLWTLTPSMQKKNVTNSIQYPAILTLNLIHNS